MGLGSLAKADKRTSIIIIALLTGAQAIVLVPNMFNHDLYQDYNDNILPFVFSCEINEVPEINDRPTRNPLKYWLHCASFNLTGYPNTLLIPFAVGILPVVYYLGYYVTADRRIGLIAMLAMVINPYYSMWVNSGTYDQVWAFFLLLSVVLLFRHQGKGTISFIVSVLGKSMALAYFPMWIYTSWKTSRTKTWPIFFLSIAGVAIPASIYFGLAQRMIGSSIGFYSENLVEAATSNISAFWMIIPLLIGMVAWNRGIRSKNPPKNKSLVLVWILGVFAMTVLIHIFTQQQTYGYRYVPFAAFVSVYLGQVVIETLQHLQEDKARRPATPYKSKMESESNG